MAVALVVEGLNAIALAGGSGGGGGVTSVNGDVGPAVVLTAASVGADAAGAAAAAQAASQPVDADLTALAAMSATAGLVARTGAGAFTQRTLTGTAGNVSVADGDGAAANPTINLVIAALADVASMGANVSQGTPHFQQRNEPGSVTRLVGQIVLGNVTFAANSVLATLNVGGRPTDPVTFLIRTKVGNVQSLINIATNGQVTNQSSIIATGTDSINFDGMTFIHA